MIPVNEPDVGPYAEELVADCVSSGWISSAGDYVEEFEAGFADLAGTEHAVSCCNGTAALELALTAVGVGRDDEVVMPAHTIVSCPLAVLRRGATPVLVDVEPESWQLDADALADAISRDTAAVMPVHLFGHPTDMDPVLELAADHDLRVIEDAAEAHGAAYRGEPVGSLGDVAAFSCYANKLVTTGEGGVVTTDDPALAERARDARNLFFRSDRRFVHDELGYNYRLTNLQAAVGVAQLERVDEFVERKRWQRRAYLDRLGDVDAVTPQRVQPWADHVNWMFGLVLDDSVPFDAAEWGDRLADRGVGSRPFFWPLHEQPVFEEMGLFEGESYPVAERLARRGRYLPSGMALTEDQLDRAAHAAVETLP